MSDAPASPEPPWTVERWGGQSRLKERVIFSGTEADARERFEQDWRCVHQGTLRLRRPNGATELLATSSGLQR